MHPHDSRIGDWSVLPITCSRGGTQFLGASPDSELLAYPPAREVHLVSVPRNHPRAASVAD